MSHLDPPATGLGSAVDEAAEREVVQAIIGHHAQLATGLGQRVDELLDLVATDHLIKAETARRDLLDYLRREILPHARAEEQALYPPAAALPEGRLLIAGMVAEHRVLAELVAELAATDTPVRAGAAARALAGLFASHLYKENDLLLPLLLAAPGIRLAAVLAGMHDLLGADSADQRAEAAGVADPATGEGGCGCGGCACGGDRPASEPVASAVPMLSMDTRLDVRDVPHGQRHALVLSAVAGLPPGQAIVLVAGHAPRPVLAEIDDRFGDQVAAEWLQSGPEVWQVRLERVVAPA